jgi:hypothetical protein
MSGEYLYSWAPCSTDFSHEVCVVFGTYWATCASYNWRHYDRCKTIGRYIFACKDYSQKKMKTIAKLASLESCRVRRITVLQMLTPSFNGSCKVTLIRRKSKEIALVKWVWFCSILLFWTLFDMIEIHSVNIHSCYKFLGTVNHMAKDKL